MKIKLIIFLLLGLVLAGQAQDMAEEFRDGRKEVYFSFYKPDAADWQEVFATIYIDHLIGDSVYAYANSKQFAAFKSRNIPYKLEIAPSMKYKNPVMRKQVDLKDIQNWDFYPSYSAYIDMMQQFEADYPDLCQLVEIGTLSSGRKILALRISDNVNIREAEPEFLYTSSIHGDETTGYVLLLRLADHLLSNYGSDEQLTALIQSTDIYLNPLANPDGTFAGGNNTVYGATRTNANGIDINRNFPDPEDGPHPDGNDWQEETILFMNFAESHNFIMSANIHGGAEVCNYPWDTWSKRHADEEWWQFVCREYADTAQAYSPPGYMEAYNSGITNGYDWYSIDGGRQDYMNYFQHCREFTLEISTIKTVPASLLPDYWDYNYRSLLNYMKQVNYGIRGFVKEALTGNSVVAEVKLREHDEDNSVLYSEADYGRYNRPVARGVYNLKFSAPGYVPLYINGIDIKNRDTVNLDVNLQQADFYADFIAGQNTAETGSLISFTNLSYGDPEAYQWYFEGGMPAQSGSQIPPEILYQNPGTYDVSLTVYKDGDSSTLILEDYIKVSPFYLMNSETVQSCSGYFFDTGGMNNNYGNNQNIVMHFIPSESGKRMVFIFEEFSLEFDENCDYDWLKIYNGISVNDELIGTFCGSVIPDTIVADNSYGALTFEFHSDFSQNREGWMAGFYCDSNVSVAENTAVKQAGFFYPNPVKENKIFLESLKGIKQVQIYDMAGSLILNTVVKNGYIDISSLEKGIYIIRFASGGNIYSEKLSRL